jgi:hypothetical protein
VLINFLPHRQVSLLQQRKAFVQNMALSCLLALLAALALSQLLAQQLAHAEDTGLQLRQELKALDAQLKSMAGLQTELQATRIREAVLQFPLPVEGVNLQAIQGIFVKLSFVRLAPTGRRFCQMGKGLGFPYISAID